MCSQEVMSMVRQIPATASSLSSCIGNGSTVARVSHGFPRLLMFLVVSVHLPIYVVINSSEGQQDFQLRRLGSLFGFLVYSLITGDPT
ncbi:hypothetical protein TNCV_3052301 [Trichonephila clavipes]|nr:hypothetical protein TNCV_3052301 [Trichonephila clavipes]